MHVQRPTSWRSNGWSMRTSSEAFSPSEGDEMSKRKILITDRDMQRLRELLRVTSDPYGKDRPYLEVLRTELDRAKVVAADNIDADVVTMNSTVRVRDPENGRSTALTLVFPENADPQADRISVIAPLGAALLGYRVGDRVSFRVPTGLRTCEILEVLYQPEAAGDLHL